MENNKIIDGLNDYDKSQKQGPRILRQLLDQFIHNTNKHLVSRINMGKTQFGSAGRGIESYTGKMKISEIADRIQLGSDMSFMKNKIDESTKKVIIDEENADQILQRIPTWDRKKELTGYLVSNNFRKFTTILTVVTPAWVEDPHHENWSADGKALKDAIEFEALDSKGEIGLIDLNGHGIFALDGQHRVMGLKGLKELSNTHKFQEKNKNGKDMRASTMDEWMENYGIDDISEITQILNESISIEFVPSVLTGETREEATIRLRNIFFNINTNAKKIDSNEQTIMDEQNTFAILARAVAFGKKIGNETISKHKLFNPSPSSKSKVRSKSTSLGEKDSEIVTLQGIKEGAQKYFTATDEEEVNKLLPKGQSPRTPSDEVFKKYLKDFNELLDLIAELPVFKSIDRGDKPEDFRNSPSDKNNAETNSKLKGHLLLRKIGFPILTAAIGQVLIETEMDLRDIFDRLNKLDKEEKFSMHNPQNLWYGVTYDMFRKNMIIKNNNLAIDLLKFLITGSDTNKRAELLERLKQLRIIDQDKGLWIDFNGNQVSLSDSPDLPY